MIESHPHGSVRELRLARPPVNALDPGLIRALADAVGAAPSEGAEALVISGSEKVFSAGLDVPTLLELDREGMEQVWGDFYRLMRSLARSPIPVVAAITGASPAGGAVIALFCDRRVMVRGDKRIGLNEVRVGLPVPPVIQAALAWTVGPRRAERLCTEGLLVTADEAYEIGLVDQLTDAGAVVAEAIAWCERLLALPREAMLETRRQGREGLAGLFEGRDQESEATVDVWFSEGTQAGLKALVASLAKR